MKLRYTMTTAALALAGLTFAAPAAKAAANSADLILSFRLTDNSVPKNLEIDLGNSSLFTTTAVLNLTYGANYYAGSNLGGLSSSDLDTVFLTSGGAWNTLSTLVWDVAGHTGTSQTNTHLFATQPVTGATAAAPGSSLTAPGGRINNMVGAQNPASSADTLVSPTGFSTATSTAQTNYTGAVSSGVTNDFGFFNPSTESHVSSTGNMTMELYNYGPGTRTDLGTLTLTPSGQLTFTGIAAVPEPSTLSALAGGVALLGLFRRRRASVA